MAEGKLNRRGQTKDTERRLNHLRRVVVWGHPLHSHTHSYVHEAFARAFRYLGVETLWTDDVRVVAGLTLPGTLFVSEGQVLEGLPLRPDCHYVLHNAEFSQYEEVADRVLALAVLTSDVYDLYGQGGFERVDPWTYVGTSDGVAHLCQPWATDLLPDEFDMDPTLPRPWPKGRLRARARVLRDGPFTAIWIGTIGSGEFGNEAELAPFRRACSSAGVRFVHRTGIGRAEHIRRVRRSLLAPTIVGSWQLEKGYLPCRLFKNISYGRQAVTNSPWIQSVLEEPVLCRTDTYELFWEAASRVRDVDTLLAQMREVQARHTYLNRIHRILEYLP